MCGIAGFIDQCIAPGERPALLGRMLENISHRGPDARGISEQDGVVLGHNRLSIIDLSTDGNQPMRRGTNLIVYNGEVYNYREIRKDLDAEGMVFTTHSDTEVILAAYERYGRSCIERFVGMWAFAIWDAEKQELFCSRDRFGIKPFFYILESGRFYFGSEYKALYPSPLFSNTINVPMALRGLQLGWNAWQDETYYERIKALPPAHNLVLDRTGKVSVSRYWDIDTEHRIRLSPEEAMEGFRSRFLDSVHLHMRSDVEVGGCLSGGLDSSAIASVVGRDFSGSRFKTFTVYYEGRDGVDERPWVQQVLNAYPALQPHYFTPSDEDIRESFAKAIWHADVPLAGSSPISQYFVMQLAAKAGIKVLLDGQGSDEMLGGYMHSFYRLIGGLLASGHPIKALHEWRDHSSMQGFGTRKRTDLLLKSLLSGMKSEQDLYELEYRRYLPFLGLDERVNFRLNEQKGSRLNRFLYQLIFASSLPTLLQFEDRNSMAFSIESRVPFLDHRLVEYVFSLPDEFKINGGVTKRVLRESMRGLMPEAICDRKDKKGFVTPGEVKWLRGPLAFLLEQNFRMLDFLDSKRVEDVLDGFRKGDNKNASLVWRLVVLRYWMERGSKASQ